MPRATKRGPGWSTPGPYPFSIGGFPLAEFGRRPIDPDFLRGFVLDSNAEFTLMHLVDSDQFQLNGYSLFRNTDVKKWRFIQADEFLAMAAGMQDLRPLRPNPLRISSLKALLHDAGAMYPLVTLHREHIKKGVCWIGKVLATNQRSVKIFAISPDTKWDVEETYNLADLSQIQFGGAYETLLAKLATPTAASASTRSASHRTRTPSAAGSR